MGDRPTTCHPQKILDVTKTRTRKPTNFFLEKEGTLETESMKSYSQSRMDAARPISQLSTRKPFIIACWNVRTMYECSKAAMIAREMNRYKIKILGLSETHWTGTGQLRLSTGELILFSGHKNPDATHSEGVAIMLPKESQKSLLSWEAVNSRIITACFLTKKKDIKMNIIQVYAPTNDANESEKDEFYNKLQEILDLQGNKHITILMGDANAKVGDTNIGYERIMGQNGLGVMNENGERLADLCMLNDLVIGGSIFPHKTVHKATWVSPDHTTENQIDHICVSRSFR